MSCSAIERNRMPRMPRVTAQQAERAILRDGWRFASSTGSHHHYRHPSKPGKVTIAHHAGQIISPKSTASIIKQAGLTVDQFRAFL